MVPDITSRAPLSAVQTVSADEEASADRRWQQWQLKNVAANRKDARRMRVVLTAVIAALAMWLAIQFLAPSLLS